MNNFASNDMTLLLVGRRQAEIVAGILQTLSQGDQPRHEQGLAQRIVRVDLDRDGYQEAVVRDGRRDIVIADAGGAVGKERHHPQSGRRPLDTQRRSIEARRRGRNFAQRARQAVLVTE